MLIKRILHDLHNNKTRMWIAEIHAIILLKLLHDSYCSVYWIFVLLLFASGSERVSSFHDEWKW